MPRSARSTSCTHRPDRGSWPSRPGSRGIHRDRRGHRGRSGQQPSQASRSGQDQGHDDAGRKNSRTPQVAHHDPLPDARLHRCDPIQQTACCARRVMASVLTTDPPLIPRHTSQRWPRQHPPAGGGPTAYLCIDTLWPAVLICRCQGAFTWLSSTRWPSGSRRKQRISEPQSCGGVRKAAPRDRSVS